MAAHVWALWKCYSKILSTYAPGHYNSGAKKIDIWQFSLRKTEHDIKHIVELIR
jgi:hypothetical protein